VPDAITPVGLSAKGPDLGTLSSILGIQQQQQNLQTGQYTQQSAAAKAEADTQMMNERLLLQTAVKTKTNPFTGDSLLSDNPDPVTGKPTMDPQKLASFADNLPLTGQQVKQSVYATQKAKTDLAQSTLGLQDSARDRAAGIIMAHGDDPKATSASVAQEVEDSFGDDKNVSTVGVVNNVRRLLAIADGKDSATKKDAYNHVAQIFDPAAAVRVLRQPSYADTQTPQGLQPRQTNPQALVPTGLAGTPVRNATPPTTTLGPNGQIVQVAPGGAPGTGVTAAGVGMGGQSPPQSKLPPLARPAPNAPAADQQNYKARIEAAGQEYQGVSSAAADPINGVQATRYRNQTILDLIPHADTGPGRALLNKAASALPGSSGDAYQDLEHYTAQNSAALASKMGVPSTNLGAQTAAAAAGNVERNPGALAEITKTNDALNTAFDLYNRGLAKVTNNGSDMSRAASYKQAFGQNLDINAIRWADAHRRGDKEEIAALAKQGPKAIAAWNQKLGTLKALADKGDLP
jgi:hypothetical protein